MQADIEKDEMKLRQYNTASIPQKQNIGKKPNS